MINRAHRRFARSVDPYADGELDPRSAARFAQHLVGCEDCHHELVMIWAIKGSLHRLAAKDSPTLSVARRRRWATRLEE